MRHIVLEVVALVSYPMLLLWTLLYRITHYTNRIGSYQTAQGNCRVPRYIAQLPPHEIDIPRVEAEGVCVPDLDAVHRHRGGDAGGEALTKRRGRLSGGRHNQHVYCPKQREADVRLLVLSTHTGRVGAEAVPESEHQSLHALQDQDDDRVGHVSQGWGDEQLCANHHTTRGHLLEPHLELHFELLALAGKHMPVLLVILAQVAVCVGQKKHMSGYVLQKRVKG